jgi:Ras family protein T1
VRLSKLIPILIIYSMIDRYSSIPGGADRAMTAATRFRMYVTVTALIGGCTGALLMVYRTLLRPGGGIPASLSRLGGWLLGVRRE